MRITIAPTNDQTDRESDCKHPSVTVKHPDDDLDIWQVVEMFKGLLAAWGFDGETIKMVLGDMYADSPISPLAVNKEAE